VGQGSSGPAEGFDFAGILVFVDCADAGHVQGSDLVGSFNGSQSRSRTREKRRFYFGFGVEKFETVFEIGRNQVSGSDEVFEIGIERTRGWSAGR
jgi:hypothetical protein